MKSLHTLKQTESAKIAQDLAAWLASGHKPEILPAPGSGHLLTHHYTLRTKSDDEYAKKGKFKGAS